MNRTTPPSAGNESGYLTAPIGRTMIRTAVPMLAATLAMSGYNLADAYFVGKLGRDPLAAMGFTLPVVMLYGCLFHGMGTGVMTTVAHALGGSRHARAARIATSGIVLTLLITVVAAVLGIIFMEPTFRWLGAQEDLMPMIREYMLIWYIGAPTAVLSMVGNNILVTAADAKIASVIMMSGMVVNAIFDPFFIFGFWFIPAMGITGAALATVGSQLAVTLGVLTVVRVRHRLLEMPSFDWRIIRSTWWMVTRIAVPSILGMLLMPIGSTITTKILAEFGRAAVAAGNSASRLEGVAFVIPMSLGMSMMPIIGQNFGAGKFDRINQCRRFASRFAISFEFGVAILICAFAPWIAPWFSTDKEVVEIMVWYFRIVPWGFGLLEVHRYSCFTFTGCNRPAATAWLSFLRIGVLLIPLSVLAWKMGSVKALFAARLVSDVLAGGIAMFCAHLLTLSLLKKAGK